MNDDIMFKTGIQFAAEELKGRMEIMTIKEQITYGNWSGSIMDFLKSRNIPKQDKLDTVIQGKYCSDTQLLLFACSCAEACLEIEKMYIREFLDAIDALKRYAFGLLSKDELNVCIKKLSDSVYNNGVFSLSYLYERHDNRDGTGNKATNSFRAIELASQVYSPQYAAKEVYQYELYLLKEHGNNVTQIEAAKNLQIQRLIEIIEEKTEGER